ncbi:MAG: GW dipeptide domain-containing protein [Thermodesulfovibrionia bacterium]|nr:GW dipeptide domain-containing protein [Thermodesulfovibrionia bacterium]
MKRFVKLFALLLLVISIAAVNTACNSKKKPAETKQQEQTTPQAGPITTDTRPIISGKVAETMNSGGYTYVKLTKDGKEIWVAITEADIKKGEEMSFYSGDEMRNFTSKTLNRTFDSVIFSPGIVGKAGDPNAAPFMSKGAVVTEKQKVKVEKAAGANSYTIADLYSKSADLNAKSVKVKGVVVKVSPSIMGKNWVHIQDGTGDAAAGTHDLVLTTDSIPLDGETITATGTLAKDKDFGGGYAYKVILENASISK